MSTASAASGIGAILRVAPAAHPLRPNTPVLPFGAVASVATFVDPSVRIQYGQHIAIGRQDFIAPYATLDAGPPGFIKIGSGTTVQDDAIIQGNPNKISGPAGVVLGDNVVIGPGATVRGPAQVGALGSTRPASVGANALIDGAVIQPGAIVGPLARVGPGVIVPSGVYVLPGVSVSSESEATTPALGKVRAVTAADLAAVTTAVSNNKTLALGYTQLYQGNSATGVSPGVSPTVTTVFNGNLAAVTGSSSEPGPGTSSAPIVPFEPAASLPNFGGIAYPHPLLGARLTGRAVFGQNARPTVRGFGRGDVIRADEGQPITIASVGRIGNDVSIHAPVNGTVVIGANIVLGDGSHVLGGAKPPTTLGNDVVVGPGAVIDASSAIGNNSTIGDRSYIRNSTLPPGSVVPAGTILINNVVVRTIEW